MLSGSIYQLHTSFTGTEAQSLTFCPCSHTQKGNTFCRNHTVPGASALSTAMGGTLFQSAPAFHVHYLCFSSPSPFLCEFFCMPPKQGGIVLDFTASCAPAAVS